MAGCHKFLGVRILCSCHCLQGSGHNVPVSLQQDIYCSLLSMEKVIGNALESRALTKGYYV